MIVDDLPPLFLRLLAVAFGLLWGSFLNVVIYRVPREMSVVRPASHCPACGVPIRAWQNVPVFGWLFLRGKARCCGAKISARYPMVEAVGGVLSLAILEMIIFRLDPGTPIARAAAIYCVDLTLALGLTAAAFIDLEWMILPDSMTLGGAVLGLASCGFRSISYKDSLIGAAIGFAGVWLPFVFLYPRVRNPLVASFMWAFQPFRRLIAAVLGRPRPEPPDYPKGRSSVGMGIGDAKLLGLAGAWFGWQGVVFTLGAGAIQGTVVAVGSLLSGRKLDDPEEVTRQREAWEAELAKMTPEQRAAEEKAAAEDPMMKEAGEGLGQARMPFGPFLVLGIIEYLFFGPELFANYLTFIGA